jgi:hypothetical protein
MSHNASGSTQDSLVAALAGAITTALVALSKISLGITSDVLNEFPVSTGKDSSCAFSDPGPASMST